MLQVIKQNSKNCLAKRVTDKPGPNKEITWKLHNFVKSEFVTFT